MCDDQASLIFCRDYQCLKLCWARVWETYEGVSLPWSSQGLKGQPQGGTDVSCHVGAGIQTQVLGKCSKH